MKTTKTISDLNAKFQQRVRKLTEEYDYQRLQSQTYADYMVALLLAYEQERARINEVEPKYYVLTTTGIPLLEKVNNLIQTTPTRLTIYEKGRDNSRFQLTEREIKLFGDEYWAMAKPVEDDYYAMVKDHENFTNDFKYWNYNQKHLILGSKHPKASHTNIMTKKRWNELGINDSNADFVKVKE